MAVRDALTGRSLGEFVLRERIGEGGFGAVYRAQQPLLGREAVIKVLHTSLRSSEVVLQRFTREAQLASRLDHPYAAHIYAFGVEKEDGLCWIAMELVQGTTLDRWLRDRGPLPIAQLVPFFERVAEVVQTAHEGGIIHRDLKPSNIMVIERAGRLLPKLLDFGIAKMVGTTPPSRPTPQPIAAVSPPAETSAAPTPVRRAKSISVQGDAATLLPVGAAATPMPAPPSPTPPPPVALKPSEVATLPPDPNAAWSVSPSGEIPALTKEDATIGSPPYMSPEQWVDATRVGPSADLYALGIVAFETLTGRRPYVATSLTALAAMHCHDPIPSVGEGFPAAFDRFFARALAKAPDDRPATALELAATLRVAAGVGSAPEDVPRLEEGVRDAWLAEAPQNLAEGIAELDGARNLHQARDAARDLFRGLLRYLVAIALAARAQIRSERDDPAVRDLLRALRTRELDEDERVKLLRLLVRPFADRRGVYPVPELVDFVATAPAGSGERDALDQLLELRPSTDHVGTEDIVRSQLVQFIPALARVLRAAAFVLDYSLVIPRDKVAERWMGLRRPRRTVAFVRDAELADDQAVLLDREGRRVLVLSPLLQPIAPTSGTERESFVFDGRGRLGARLTAAPAGYEHHDPTVWDWFAEHVLGEVEGEEAQRDDDKPPYLGLASFSTNDADRFVGREREIDAFVNRLRRQALQVVVGPSGAGKSSFVHAGVVPNLPSGWRTVTMRPGTHPLATLAARLAAAGVSSTDLRPLFDAAPAAAAALVAHAAGDGAIVLVIDQLEELFTLCSSADERDKLAAMLAHLSASPEGTTRVICTVRDDFLMHVESLAPLRAALSAGLFLIGNPSREDLVRTLVEPARRIGYAMSDAELASDMVSVVADRPGALALLSFTASRLWELRDRRFKQLTRRAYDGMGGVAGALGQHAETTFLALVADEQRVAREAFRYLVTADMTRAVLVRDELRQRLASARADAVIDKLVEARLLAVIEGEGHPRIEIIHEALIAAWPRLQQWSREDTVDSRNRDEIRAAAKQWADRGRPRELLWRGDLLAELKRWRARIALTDVEAAFADASRADAARGARIRRAIAVVAIALTAVFVVGLARARATAQDAQLHAEDLLRDSKLDQGRLHMLQGDKLGALPLLAEAYRRGATGEANRLMIEEALRPTRARTATLAGHAAKIWQVTYSADGALLATASDDGTARVWDARTGALRDTVPLKGVAEVVAFSPDGKLLAVAGRDPDVHVWDLSARREVAAAHFLAYVTSVAFSSDGKQLLVGDSGGSWSLGSLGADNGSDGVVVERGLETYPTLSTDGARVTAWTAGGTRIGIWDARQHSEDPVARFETKAPVGGGAAAPDGTALAVGTTDGELDILHADGSVTAKPTAHAGKIVVAAYTKDGKRLATGGDDGVVKIWSAAGQLLVTIAGHREELTSLQFSPDGELVVTAATDGVVELWSAATGIPRGELLGHAQRAYATFAPDGKQIATASWDHRAMLWDTAAALEFRALPPAVVEPTQTRAQIKYSPRAGQLAMIGSDGLVAVMTGGAITCKLADLTATADFAWSPDGALLAAYAQDAHVVGLYDAHTCARLAELDQGDGVFALAFDAAGTLATGGLDKVVLWDVSARRVRDTLNDYAGYVIDVGFAPDGRLYALTYRDNEPSSVVVRTLGAGGHALKLTGPARAISAVAFDAARHLVLASSYDQRVWEWDDRSGELVAKLEATGPLWGVVRSPDGALVIGVGGNAPVVWDASSRAKLAALERHSGLVTRGHFIGDRLFVTSSTDGVAKVWDLSTFQALLTFSDAQVADVSPDGKEIVLSDATGTRVWSPRAPAPDLDAITRVTAP